MSRRYYLLRAEKMGEEVHRLVSIEQWNIDKRDPDHCPAYYFDGLVNDDAIVCEVDIDHDADDLPDIVGY